MTTAKRAKLRPAKSKASTTRSSSPSVVTHSISSLLGELDDAPDTDIRSASLEEIREMAVREKLSPTRRGTNEVEVELDESFWKSAKSMPSLFAQEGAVPRKTSVHLRLDHEVADWFRRQGKGHLTRMNAVLRAYYEANRNKAS